MSWFCLLFAGLIFGQTGDISSRLDGNLTAVAMYEYGGSREPLSEINEIIKTAVKSPEIGEQVEKQFIEFLKSNATLAGKQFICRKLCIIGTKASVTVLSRMLDVDETFDMALYALEKNPSSNVDKILSKAMQKVDGKQKIGLISTLGIRRYRPSVDDLQKLVFDQDHEIVVAAIRSLSQIGTDEASHALFVTYQKTSGHIRTEAMNGYLQCADLMVEEGKVDVAKSMYQGFMIPDAIRSAALTGLIQAEPDRAGEILLDVLHGDDVQLKSIAIRHVGRLDRVDHLEEIAETLPGLSNLQQIQLITALAERGDPAFRDVAIEAADYDDVEVRIAAMKALAVLGDASTLDLLLKKAVEGGPEQEPARESLYRIRGTDIDRAMITMLSTAGPDTRIELLTGIGQRNITSATRMVFNLTRNDVPQVRQEAVKTLGLICTPDHLPEVIDVLIAAKTAAERKEAERTVVTLSRQIDDEDNQAMHILASLPKAESVDSKSSLLEVMGRIGDVHTLPDIRNGLKSENAGIQKASIRALSQWPNAIPIDDLFEVAKTSQDNVSKILALRGYIRLIGIYREKEDDERVEMYGKAFQLASETNDKRMVLSGLANLKTIGALEMAGRRMDEPDLCQEAEVAVIRITGRLWEDNPQEVLPFLHRIVQSSTNEDQKANAQRLIERIKDKK